MQGDAEGQTDESQPPPSKLLCRLKWVVLTLNVASMPLFFVAAILDHWLIVTDLRANAGLMRTCNPSGCYFFIKSAGAALGLLFTALIMSILIALPCGILEVWHARKGRLGCMSCVAGTQFIIGILGFAGMIAGTVFLLALVEGYRFYFSWTYAIGWFAVICALASGGVSVYIYVVEPKNPSSEGGLATVLLNWQPQAPTWKSQNALPMRSDNWQPQAPTMVPQQYPGQQPLNGAAQPINFTWQPYIGVMPMQQTEWQPPQQTVTQPAQAENPGWKPPQKTMPQSQEGQILPHQANRQPDQSEGSPQQTSTQHEQVEKLP
ncbi:hypothetical protein NDU88_010825 [Pleurodeles waltl]|uniref:Uncharacterized protein n=1 Tax=Pleurodeles waltl TaxID=8319 RepID=A0AAV7PW04_PLEWA|nr:hypothetical protein NDU88_010825 [Pleurodeles waltl]